MATPVGSPRSGNILSIPQAPAKSSSALPSCITDKVEIATNGMLVPTAFTQARNLQGKIEPRGDVTPGVVRANPVVVPAKQQVTLPSLALATAVVAESSVASSSSSTASRAAFDEEYAEVISGDDANAQYAMGLRCLFEGKRDEGLVCLEKAADYSLEAVIKLIDIYAQDLSYRDANGELVNETKYLRSLIIANRTYSHPKSQFILGSIFEKGCESYPKNLRFAQHYYELVLNNTDSSLKAEAQERLNVVNALLVKEALGISSAPSFQDQEGKAPLRVGTQFDSHDEFAEGDSPEVSPSATRGTSAPQAWAAPALADPAAIHESKQPMASQDDISTSPSSSTSMVTAPAPLVSISASKNFKATLISRIEARTSRYSEVDFTKWLAKMEADFPSPEKYEDYMNWGNKIALATEVNFSKFRKIYVEAYEDAVMNLMYEVFPYGKPDGKVKAEKVLPNADSFEPFIRDICNNLPPISFAEICPDYNVHSELMNGVRNVIRYNIKRVEGARENLSIMLAKLNRREAVKSPFGARVAIVYESIFEEINARQLQREAKHSEAVAQQLAEEMFRRNYAAANQSLLVRTAGLVKAGLNIAVCGFARLDPRRLLQGSGAAATPVRDPHLFPEPPVDHQ